VWACKHSKATFCRRITFVRRILSTEPKNEQRTQESHGWKLQQSLTNPHAIYI
jgi:phosphoribosylaminoimidazole (AIR) synthetase